MKAKKEVSREMNGDIETIKNHVIEDIKIKEEIIDFMQEKIDDDSESGYVYGMYGDFNGELYLIEINLFITFLEEEVENEYADDGDKDKYNQWISDLTKFRNYSVYL